MQQCYLSLTGIEERKSEGNEEERREMKGKEERREMKGKEERRRNDEEMGK